MRIDRAAFLALALGGGFAVTACGTTRPAAAPTHHGDDMEPTEEGGFESPYVAPTVECVEWDPTGECVGWEGDEADPSFVDE